MTECGFSRRRLLQCVAAGTASAIAAGAQGAAAQSKSPQQAAGYQATPNGSQRCGNCAHFQPPSSCKVVAGKISPQGWCRIYFAKAG